LNKAAKRYLKNRRIAVKAASRLLQTQSPDKGLLWAYTVFFDRYMDVGMKGTMKHFGPKKAKVLKLVPKA
jgi:hypothetical protein